jgi:hypothetical protein
VGIWGQRYRRWLKENHRVLYYNLLTSGKLNERVAEADTRAEALKAVDPMAWVRRMNNIRQRATEVVLEEILVI